MEKKSVFEETSISKAIFRVGIPVMIGTASTLIYNIADIFFISLTRVPAMIAAVYLCSPILLFIMALGIIFGMGGSDIIIHYSEDNRQEITSKIFNFCTLSLILTGLLILILGLVFLGPVSLLTGADSENFSYTSEYLKWIFIGTPVNILAIGYFHLFRSIGLSKQSTIGFIAGTITNIVLDVILINILGWGTKGAAIATSLGYAFSLLYYICVIVFHKKSIFYRYLFSFKISKKTALQIIRVGFVCALNTLMISICNIIMDNFIGLYGTESMASFGIAYNLNLIPVLLSTSLCQACIPLLSYYYDTKQKDMLHMTMIAAILYSILIGMLFAVIFYFSCSIYVSLFLIDEVLAYKTCKFLRIIVISAPLIGISNMISNYFTAIGSNKKSLLIYIIRNTILYIPVVIILNSIYQLNGILFTQPVVEVILMIICLVMYLLDDARLDKLDE